MPYTVEDATDADTAKENTLHLERRDIFVKYNCGRNINVTIYFEHIPKKLLKKKMIKAAIYFGFDPEFCAILGSSF